MKYPLRLLLLLLLSFTLPVNGIAQALAAVPQAAATHADMQMQAPLAQQAMSGGESECFDNQAPGKGSMVCKTGQECKTNSLVQFSFGKAPLFPLGQHLLIQPAEPVLALIPDAVWHPPRS